MFFVPCGALARISMQRKLVQVKVHAFKIVGVSEKLKRIVGNSMKS